MSSLRRLLAVLLLACFPSVLLKLCLKSRDYLVILVCFERDLIFNCLLHVCALLTLLTEVLIEVLVVLLLV